MLQASADNTSMEMKDSYIARVSILIVSATIILVPIFFSGEPRSGQYAIGALISCFFIFSMIRTPARCLFASPDGLWIRSQTRLFHWPDIARISHHFQFEQQVAVEMVNGNKILCRLPYGPFSKKEIDQFCSFCNEGYLITRH
ncbi:MAG: hypothetical protein Q7R40_18460 [Phaeospirillum sp.]|nr:hypothetical protein [Phaeospirillum sp.]